MSNSVPLYSLLEKGLTLMNKVTAPMEFSKSDWIDLVNFESAVNLVIKNEKEAFEKNAAEASETPAEAN